MLAQHTTQYQNNLVLEYIASNLVALLIYKPDLGLTDFPSDTELLNRRALTMSTAATAELAVLNGYTRRTVALVVASSTDPNTVIYTSSTTFTASGTGPFSQATHICYARGVNLLGGNAGNGNNASDTAGTIIKVEPLLNAPLVVPTSTTFTHTTKFIVSNRLLSNI